MYKYGYYRVGNEIHHSAMLAHLAASKTKTTVHWVYHEEVFSNVNKENLGKFSLDFYYHQRALQLRDKYDYLILNYSGGSDSHNILMTFLNNSIHLDQITVRFPFSALNNNVHRANNVNTHHENRYSEWDYTIKPSLKWVSEKYPKIKIVLLDWLSKSSTANVNEDSFIQPRGGWFLSSMLRSASISRDPGETEMLDKGKTVGMLWGVDKPRMISLSSNAGEKVYMSIRDKPISLFSPTLHNPNGTEYFYWTPDMPELAYEMAYQVFKFFDRHKDLRYVITGGSGKPNPIVGNFKWQKFCDLTCDVLYTTWDHSRFQTDKGTFGITKNMRPGDAVIETLTEVQDVKNKWLYMWKSYDKELDRSVNSILDNGEFTNVTSKWHYVGTFS